LFDRGDDIVDGEFVQRIGRDAELEPMHAILGGGIRSGNGATEQRQTEGGERRGFEGGTTEMGDWLCMAEIEWLRRVRALQGSGDVRKNWQDRNSKACALSPVAWQSPEKMIQGADAKEGGRGCPLKKRQTP